MTTIIDPDGTPSVVYSDDGTTVATVAGSGSTQGAATAIVRHAKTTIILGTGTETDYAFKLPTDAKIGDIVEFYMLSGAADFVAVFPGSGDTYLGGSSSYHGASGAQGVQVRRVAANTWGLLAH